ncbi:MAG: hypothetical protein GVY16_04375 [Planctomycetes bacterium]|jgi:hypothetical protein|nr:hypothetical protein [Phycisphaerae bacterium]NBB94957.1 hypothetical protein [Planctomycetota bacterium]
MNVIARYVVWLLIIRLTLLTNQGNNDFSRRGARRSPHRRRCRPNLFAEFEQAQGPPLDEILDAANQPIRLRFRSLMLGDPCLSGRPALFVLTPP